MGSTFDLSLLNFIVPIGSVVTVLVWAIRLEGIVNAAREKLTQVELRLSSAQRELSDFKEMVPTVYVTFTTLKDLEDRIIRQFDRLFAAVIRDQERRQ